VGQGQAVYHTAGALGIGEQVWIMAKLPNPVTVVKGDDVERFLLLTNTHNGKGALRMFYTPVRVVCQNTLNMALGGKDVRSGVSIRHIGDIDARVSEAQEALGMAIKFYDDFAGLTKSLVGVKLNEAKAKEYFKRVVPSKKDDDKEATRTKNVRGEMVRLFHEGKGNNLPGVRGTAWAAVNAAVEYVDYMRKPHTRKGENADSLRLESVWFGSGARIKARAWDEALALVPSTMKTIN